LDNFYQIQTKCYRNSDTVFFFPILSSKWGLIKKWLIKMCFVRLLCRRWFGVGAEAMANRSKILPNILPKLCMPKFWMSSLFKLEFEVRGESLTQIWPIATWIQAPSKTFQNFGIFTAIRIAIKKGVIYMLQWLCTRWVILCTPECF
jgi:hypothetical protein